MICLSDFASQNLSKWLWHVRCSLTIHGSSQKSLAKYLCTQESNVSKILSGKTMPSISFYFGTEDFLNQILLNK